MNNYVLNVTSNSLSNLAYVNDTVSKTEFEKLEKYVEEKLAEPEVRLDQRTALDASHKAITALYYKDGKKTGSKYIMPDIKSVEVYNDNTIKITFANGDVQTATAQNGDEFSFETGTMICLMKEMLGREGSQILGKLIDYSTKIFNDAERAKQKAALEAAERLAAQKRQKERMNRRWEQKRAKEKEARIQEMAEAIIRANSVLGVNKKTK